MSSPRSHRQIGQKTMRSGSASDFNDITESRDDRSDLDHARSEYRNILGNAESGPRRYGNRMRTTRNGYRFQKDLRKMMYGFGDDLEPDERTAELMEQYITEFVTNLCNRAMSRSLRGGNEHMQLGDVIHFLERDPKKLYRIPHILESSKFAKKNDEWMKKHFT